MKTTIAAFGIIACMATSASATITEEDRKGQGKVIAQMFVIMKECKYTHSVDDDIGLRNVLLALKMAGEDNPEIDDETRATAVKFYEQIKVLGASHWCGIQRIAIGHGPGKIFKE